jgi:hypothetical protein
LVFYMGLSASVVPNFNLKQHCRAVSRTPVSVCNHSRSTLKTLLCLSPFCSHFCSPSGACGTTARLCCRADAEAAPAAGAEPDESSRGAAPRVQRCGVAGRHPEWTQLVGEPGHKQDQQ